MELNGSVSVHLSDVPDYLHGSEFYQTLSSDDGEEITVPRNCMKMDKLIGSETDVVHLLHTVRFWGVHDVPMEVARYFLSDGNIVTADILSEFGFALPYLGIIEKLQYKSKREMIDRAIEYNDFSLVQAMYTIGFAWTDHSAAIAAGVNVDCLKFIRSHGGSWNYLAPYEAARNGQLACLQYTRQEGCSWDSKILSIAFEKDVECARYVVEVATPEEREQWVNVHTPGNAIYNSHGALEMLRFIHSVGCPWDENTTFVAVQENALDCLRYAHQNGCPVSDRAMTEAARWGRIACLEYLHLNCGVPWSEQTCVVAVEGHSLRALKYLHENGCPWNSHVCIAAACYGNLDILIYAHEQGCLWDEQVCRFAAERGHLECLKYAHENGCEWESSTCFAASKNQNSATCLQYAIEQGCPGPQKDCLISAAMCQSIPCLDYLLKIGCVATIDTAVAAMRCMEIYPANSRQLLWYHERALKCLQFLCENGCPLDATVLQSALNRGNVKCVQYLVNRGCPYDAALCGRANEKGLSIMDGVCQQST